MIPRQLAKTVLDDLDFFPSVALTGPRQIGKTTLARAIAESRPSLYLDLESQTDRDKLRDAELLLTSHLDRLVIIDEVQRAPQIFQLLRGKIDEARRMGLKSGRYLLLGSASMDLLRQTGESLAGRIACLELGPIGPLEIESSQRELLWVRGGFPDSFLAASDAQSLRWRSQLIRSYLERDIPALAPRLPTVTSGRLWTMLAHSHGSLINASLLAQSLMIDSKTVARHLDLFVDLLLVRRLLPYHANLGKRLVKAPKIYQRDSGILHALLGIGSLDGLLGHPVAGLSWEGFVIESLLNVAPGGSSGWFFRTAAGAEIDLLIELPGGKLWAIEIKTGIPRVSKGFHIACGDLKPERRFIVHTGEDRYPKPHDIEAIGLSELSGMLRAMH